MGFFDHLQTKGSAPIKSQTLSIRKEVVQQKNPFHTSVVQAKPRTASPVKRSPGKATSKSLSPGIQPVKTPQARRKRLTPAVCGLTSSSDESESEAKSAPSKRQKTDDAVDCTRKLRSEIAFLIEDDGRFEFVHAADIAGSLKSGEYLPAFEGVDEDLQVTLQYPSLSQRERCVALSSHRSCAWAHVV